MDDAKSSSVVIASEKLKPSSTGDRKSTSTVQVDNSAKLLMDSGNGKVCSGLP